MGGTLALVGSGEFLDVMRPVDARLLERAGGASQTRVMIIPTAAVPDGPAVVARWAALGRAHFGALGASVDVVVLGADDDANDPALAARIAASQLVYFSGGKPDFLLKTLQGTRAWDAVHSVYANGGVLAGCSAGAMILGSTMVLPRLRLGWPWGVTDAFGLVPASAILPHYDVMPASIPALLSSTLPPDLSLIGIDEDTALLSDGDGWQVLGRSGAEILRAGTRRRYRSGERIVLERA